MDAIGLLNDAQKAYSARDYAKALEIIATAELEGKACPSAFLLKGACIQLAEQTDYSPADAAVIYKALLAVRPNDPDAHAEMGFLMLNILGQSEQSLAHFSRSLDIYEKRIVEVLVGRCKAGLETSLTREQTLQNLRAYLYRLEEATLKAIDY